MRVRVGADGIILIAVIMLEGSFAMGCALMLAAAIHELGHIFAARLLGIEMCELRICFSGARLYPKEQCIPYRSEMLLAMAGPLFSFVCALAVVIFVSAFCSDTEALRGGVISALNGGECNAVIFIVLFGIASLMQGIMNLLPIESLDGGRVLSSAVALVFGERAAMMLERALTVICAVTIWLFSVYLLLRTGSGIGIYFCAICVFVKYIL